MKQKLINIAATVLLTFGRAVDTIFLGTFGDVSFIPWGGVTCAKDVSIQPILQWVQLPISLVKVYLCHKCHSLIVIIKTSVVNGWSNCSHFIFMLFKSQTSGKAAMYLPMIGCVEYIKRDASHWYWHAVLLGCTQWKLTPEPKWILLVK